MHVLVGEQHRLLPPPARRAGRPALRSVRCFWRCGVRSSSRVAIRRRHAEQRRDQRHRLVAAGRCRAPAAPPACRACASGGSSRSKPAARSSCSITGCSGLVGVMRRALVEQARCGARPRCCSRSSAHQARLADARLAREQHHLALAVLAPAASGAAAARAPPRARPAASAPAVCTRLEATFGSALALRPATLRAARRSPSAVCGPRSSSSNSAARRSRRVAWPITTVPGSRQRLEPRREVRASRRPPPPPRRALADQIAHHDDARRDADPRLEAHFRMSVERGRPPAVRSSPARTARSASSSCAFGQPK